VPAQPDFLGKVAREWQSRRSDGNPCHSTGILTLLAGLDSTNCELGFCNRAFLQRIMHLNEKQIGLFAVIHNAFPIQGQATSSWTYCGSGRSVAQCLGYQTRPFRSRIAALAVQPWEDCWLDTFDRDPVKVKQRRRDFTP
jgi:hypothetical protein